MKEIRWQEAGATLRTLRTELGISQAKLAGLLRVSEQTIRNYETGVTKPGRRGAEEMKRLLGTDPWEGAEAAPPEKPQEASGEAQQTERKRTGYYSLPKKRLERLAVGDTVTRKPYAAATQGASLTGTVIFVHPGNRWHTVEFQNATGGSWRESFWTGMVPG